MKNIRFANFQYTVNDLPEGVVFFGRNEQGIFHQMTRNADPADESVSLYEAVAETIKQAEEMAEEGSSVGFESPIYHVTPSGIPYARVTSVLTSSGGLSFADNVFFYDEDRILHQIQCGSLLTTPRSALISRKKLQEHVGEMMDIIVGASS